MKKSQRRAGLQVSEHCGLDKSRQRTTITVRTSAHHGRLRIALVSSARFRESQRRTLLARDRKVRALGVRFRLFAFVVSMHGVDKCNTKTA